MDWSNEDYVRVYTRDTADDLELSWQALALWHAMLRKFDRSGLMPVRNGWSSVAKSVRMPDDVVLAAGRELERDGRVMRTKRGMFAPNFTEAQTAKKSDKARQQASRDRRRAEAAESAGTDETPQTPVKALESTKSRHAESQAVTSESRDVTLCSATPPVALPPVALRCVDQTANESPVPTRKPKRRRHRLPVDWNPNEAAEQYAREHRLDLNATAGKFKRHYASTGAVRVDWDEAFAGWLEGDAERSSRNGARASPSQTVLEVLKSQIAESEEPDHDQH